MINVTVGGSSPVSMPWLSLVPFIALLASIAFLPVAWPRIWHSHRLRAFVVATPTVPFAAWLIWSRGDRGWAALAHAGEDYVAFVAMLGALFVISGGIHVRGSLAGTPLANSAVLAVGAVLANLIGTTGASMLLLRPFLRANERRRVRSYQVVFFLFVVSNCGGLLTPLGDPPLYLGFLKGVPFDWTIRLWPVWLLVNGLLIVVFNFYDQWALGREERARQEAVLDEVLEHRRLGVDGGHNLLFLAAVALVILGRGYGWGSEGAAWHFGVQEGLLLGLAAASFAVTRPEVRAANRFEFGPIVEVAVVFAGIFITMVAPLEILNTVGAGLGLVRPWHYFWATGGLSAFLDNAPTYLAFTAAAAGAEGVSTADPRFLATFLSRGEGASAILAAISAGAVLMGAMTYVGNGPNFMVKAIAENAGVRMPTFLGYLGWSIVVLAPIFLVVSLVFFR